MNRLPIILLSLASLGCNALAEFPDQAEPAPGLDMRVDPDPDLGTNDASSDVPDPPDDGAVPDLGPEAGFGPQPVAIETCSNGALRSRPRINVIGSKGLGAAVWVDPEQDIAKIADIKGLGRTVQFPGTTGSVEALEEANSVDVGYDADGEGDRYFFSLTRRHSPTFGIALYPTPICQQQCDDSDILWNTSVTSTRNMVHNSFRVGQREQRFWLGTEGDRVQMYMLGPDGTVQDQRSTSFCRREEADCVQPGPLESDSFGTTFETVFMRAGDGTARAWNSDGLPAPVVIDGEAVLFDDITALGELRNNEAEIYRFAHLDRDEERIRTYRAERTFGGVINLEFGQSLAQVDAEGVWRTKFVGSGDGVQHLVTTTNDGAVSVYLRRSDESLELVRSEQLTVPAGTLQNWDASASLEGRLEDNATLYLAYIGGDECAVDVTTHSFTIARQR